MKRYRFSILKSAGRVVLALLVAIGVWGLMACGGGSSNGIGGVKEPTAYVFNAQTAEKAAFLAVDYLDVFLGFSELTAAILEVAESGEDSADFSNLCDGSGTAFLNAQQPFGQGTSVILTLTDCIDEVVGGTVNFSVGGYNESAILPSTVVTMRVDVNLSGGGQTSEGQFFLRVVRNADKSEMGFLYRGFPDREAFWSITEPAPVGKTTFACFDFNLVFLGNGDGAAAVLGDRRLVSRTGGGFAATKGLIVDERNRLFGLTGAFFPVDSELRFGKEGDEWVPVSGYGLDFYSNAADNKECRVVGIDEGITPGTTSMTLRVDEEVFGGVILAVDPPDGDPIRTTWLDLLDD